MPRRSRTSQANSDKPQAPALLAQAEQMHVPDPLNMLANLRADGRGLARDIIRAAHYYQQAAAMGHGQTAKTSALRGCASGDPLASEV